MILELPSKGKLWNLGLKAQSIILEGEDLQDSILGPWNTSLAVAYLQSWEHLGIP